MGIDLKVQLQKPLVLRDADNTDWHLLQGDRDVSVKVRDTETPNLPHSLLGLLQGL